MAEARRRKRQMQTSQEEDNAIVLDGNKIVLGLGALILLIGVGVFAFWLAGQSGGPTATSQPVAQAQPQVQPAQSQAQPAKQSQPAPKSQSQTTSQPRSSSGSSSGGVSVGLSSAPDKGALAPDFTVPTLDGGTFTLSEQRGKTTVVFFMAYWCGTCVPEAQALKQLQEEYGDKLSILALDVDPSSSPGALQQFVAWAGNPSYPFGFDKDNKVAQTYKVRSLDTTIIIDAEGKIIYRDAYPTRYEKLKEEIEKIIS